LCDINGLVDMKKAQVSNNLIAIMLLSILYAYIERKELNRKKKEKRKSEI